ncbi:MAG TPA: hypothetical protein VG817_11595 [Gemmatimonadales bacterium]|nr:hypothetical protein [Gemmatimonadales bacterium]
MTLLVLDVPFLQTHLPGRQGPPVGAVLVADLSAGIPALARAVTELRSAPWCPLVTCLSDRRIASSTLSAFESVPGTFAPLYATDYATLPLPQRVVEAVRRRPPPPATAIALWVERRLGRPGTASTLGACFGDDGDALRPPRTLTRRVCALGPLEVRDWRGLARLAQIHTTAGPLERASLEVAAYDARIDPRTLRRWLRLATDLSWSDTTRRPGWEWLVEMTLRRYGYVEAERELRVGER